MAPPQAFTTVDGLVIEPLYGPEASRAGAGAPARVRQGWDVRAIVAHPDPAEANAQALESLEGGATSILLQSPVASAEDLERALKDVVLEAAGVALDQGFHGPMAAQALDGLAKGSPAARLDFHLDPISAFAAAGASPGPIEAHIELAGRTAARLAQPYPEAGLFLASGRTVHEAGGGSAALELAMAAAAAVAYARAATGAGLAIDRALGGITLGVAADGELLIALAKLRAAREIWARIAGACGSDRPARIEARSSRRMLTALDPWTNLIRLTAAGFSAAAGGADVIALETFTDALGPPTALARRLSRNIQLILMQEAGLGEAGDPAAGAFALDALTDQLARQGWAAFQAIERQGGILKALTSGWIAAEAARVREARDQAVAEERLPILGVTLHADPDGRPAAIDRPAGRSGSRPEPRLEGPDSRCPALEPRRLSEPAEQVEAELAT